MTSDYWLHDLDPVIFSLGFFDLRWYSLAYIVGIIVGWWWSVRLLPHLPRPGGTGLRPITSEHMDRFMTSWAIIAIIVGGRLGQALFYHPEYYFVHPLEIFQIWKGGMAFHGAVISGFIAMVLFARYHRVSLLQLGDVVCSVAPFGLMLGRIANFINGEHWGRISDVPWAVIFSHGGSFPRHPSQLYEAGLEGLGLLVVMVIAIYFFNSLKKPGLSGGIFLCGYAIARFFCEFFREPEVFINQLPFALTWGQLLSFPMLLAGFFLLFHVHRGQSGQKGFSS